MSKGWQETTHVLAMVLAGGQGTRLQPLTADRAKPAVPFGGIYRLIDFALSNLVNGQIRKIVVLTQYKSHSLDRHIAQLWRLAPQLGNYVATVPAQMRVGPRWFAGSADAIFQNLNLLYDERPDHVMVLGADHIYRMDPRQMLAHHVASASTSMPRARALATLTGIPSAASYTMRLSNRWSNALRRQRMAAPASDCSAYSVLRLCSGTNAGFGCAPGNDGP